MVDLFFAVTAITFPVALDKFCKFDKMTYGIISAIFGWGSATFFMMYMLEVTTK